MSVVQGMIERFRAAFRRGEQEAELTDEVAFHVEQETQRHIRDGMAPEAARRAALLAFGGVEHYKESVRDARGVKPLDDFGADVRYALRGLRRNPGFAATAIGVLGLGIGATTAVFSLMYAVVLADLPYRNPSQLVMVLEQNSPTNRWNISTADAVSIRAQQQAFEAWGEVSATQAELAGTSNPERIVVGRVSSGFFKALEVSPAVGRVILPRDEPDGSPAVVVLSSVLANRVFGGSSGAIGKTLTIDGVSHEVIGVLPPGRDDLAGVRATAWTALRLRPPVRRGPFWLRGIGRLKPGATLATASADLAAVSKRILPVWTDFRDTVARLTPYPLHEVIVGRARPQVTLFAGAVVMVLLLAITNVTTLVLVRASAREAEIGVRVMLGASGARLARLLVTENLILTLTAGVLGLGIAAGAIKLAATVLPNLPRIQTVSLDWRAVSLAIAAAVISGIVVSLSPLAVLRRRGGELLRAENRRTGTGRRTNTIRGTLVAAEFAFALPLLAGAGLLLNSFVRLQRVDPGFDPTGVVAVAVSLPTARYKNDTIVGDFWTLAEQRIAAIPGVVAVGLSSTIPPDNSGGNNNFNLVDHPVPQGQSEPNSPWYDIRPGYFQALGLKMLNGRMFTPADTVDPVLVVSASWARRFFPGENAVGRKLISGGCYDCPRSIIIGVVSDIKNVGPMGSEEAVYNPAGPGNIRQMNLVARSSMSPTATLRTMRERIRALDPNLPLTEFTLTERFQNSLADPRRWTAVLAAFAASGMVLAGLGIFGLMSYVVRQRRREIGVRLALGAQPESMTRWIVTRGMGYAVAGSAGGLAITFLAASKLQALLFGVGATDGLTIGAVTVVLLAVAFLACWIPGRQAAKILPLEALGAE